MKELLEKFFGTFSEAVSLLKEEKSEEAIKKFEEASEMKSDLTKSAEESDGEDISLNEEDLKKFFDSDDGKATLKKYVDIYLSSDSFSGLVEKLQSQLDDFQSLNKKVKELEKQKEEDDKTVSEALDKTMDDVEEIKKTLTNSRFSKVD